MSGVRPAEILRQLEQTVRTTGAEAADDRALLDRFARHRDQGAFAQLVRRHGPMVLSVCRRVTAQSQDAEDAFQAAFLVLARRAGAVRRPELLGNWLYGVAVRVARRARRAATRRRAREVQVATLPDPPTNPPAVADPDIGPVLHEELAGLPAWYREPVVLCDLRGVSRADAAKALGIPEGTLSSRLANGRKKLADRLARRGVALSAATIPIVLGDGRGLAAVPDSLVAKTCGLAADWAAGASVPGPVGRLADGGFTVRKTLLVGMMTAAVTAAGVVLAARPVAPPPVVAPPAPRAAAAVLPVPALVPEQKPDEKVPALAAAPRLQRVTDHILSRVEAFAWSPDGTRYAIRGTRASAPAAGPGRVVSGELLLVGYTSSTEERATQMLRPPAKSRLVGFTPDGKFLVTDLREHELVSGHHRLDFWAEPPPGKSVVPGVELGRGGRGEGEYAQVRSVELDGDHTYGYAFAPDGKTFRTVYMEAGRDGGVRKLEVREVSTETGRTVRTTVTAEVKLTGFELSPDGRRLAVGDQDDRVTVYDADRGEKLWTVPIRLDPDLPGMAGRDQLGSMGFAFSRDGRRLAVLGRIARPIVLDADTGKPFPALAGSDPLTAAARPWSFSPGGRLLALSGSRYVMEKKGGPGGRLQGRVSSAGRYVTVWDTDTGKVVKSWDREAKLVAFHPTRPLLAVLEANGESRTRLGLWDFAAEAGKK